MVRPGAAEAPITAATRHVLDAKTLSLLLTWFSPALPVGSFAYSHGLERLFVEGALAGADDTAQRVRLALETSGRNDAILLAASFRAAAGGDAAALGAVQVLAVALAPSAERRAETLVQGGAFAGLAAAVWPGGAPLDGEIALPVAVGVAGAAQKIPVAALVHAHLSQFVASLVSAAVRLVPLGQTGGQRVTARLAPTVEAIAAEALAASLDDIGGCALGLEIAAMRHEVQEMRLFRS